MKITQIAMEIELLHDQQLLQIKKKTFKWNFSKWVY